MFEIEVVNVNTNEYKFIYGYTEQDAFNRKGMDRKEWVVISCYYID